MLCNSPGLHCAIGRASAWAGGRKDNRQNPCGQPCGLGRIKIARCVRAHRVEDKAGRHAPGICHHAFGPVHTIGANGPGKRGIGPDQKTKSPLFGEFCEDFGQRCGFRGAEMAIDQTPARRQYGRQIQRMGRPCGIGKDQNGWQTGWQMLRGGPCGAFELA